MLICGQTDLKRGIGHTLHVFFLNVFVVCDEVINQNQQTLTSPDSPGSYGENYDCEYTYINPRGDCMVLFFVSIDLPPPNEYGICDEDYILVRKYDY